LGETALGLSGFQRYAIQQQPVVRDAKQKAAIAVLRQAMLQFIPCNFELPFRALVLKSVQAYVFHENVQAVNESARGRVPVFSLRCGGSRNT
jgi:hypothetical protein